MSAINFPFRQHDYYVKLHHLSCFDIYVCSRELQKIEEIEDTLAQNINLSKDSRANFYELK